MLNEHLIVPEPTADYQGMGDAEARSALPATGPMEKANEYDFCMVLPSGGKNKDGSKAGPGELTDQAQGYVKKLLVLGLDIYLFRGSVGSDEVFILIRASIDRLRDYADDIDFMMLLDEKVLEETARSGDLEARIGPIDINHDPGITTLRPYEKIYARYSKSVNEALYWRPQGMPHPFRENIRNKLLALLIQSKPETGGENLKIARYLRTGQVLAFYPLHNREVTAELSEEWLRLNAMPWEQPLHAVKEYFGEKIGLYFTFMSHYTKWLVFPAVVGVPVQLYTWAADDYGNAALPAYAFVVAMWAITMLEFWKREESMTAMRWGMVGYEDTERDRPDFKGKMIKSYIDGKQIKYFPTYQRSLLVTVSSIAITAAICVVIGIVASIYVLRYLVLPESSAQTIASVCNSVQIQITNYLYTMLANALTEMENYRTETEFEDSMIMKLFSFQFINSYASFFFLAFIAQGIDGGCGTGVNSCMKSLAINLAIIFGTRLTVGNVMELGLPYLTYRYRRFASLLKGKKNTFLTRELNLVRPEVEFLLDPYDVMQSSLTDYAEVAIQFGYMAMFVTALPIAALFALVANWVEVKGDAWKLLNVFQRPVLKGAEDIGTWQTIFTFLSVVAVVTNAGIAMFTMTTFDQYDYVTKIWLFIGFQYVCFLLQGLIMLIVPDEPEERVIQLKRTEFLTDKIIDKVEDDLVDEAAKADAAAVSAKPIIIDEYPQRDVHGTKAIQSSGGERAASFNVSSPLNASRE